MAGRIRTIKPELLEDEKTASLTNSQWRLFVSLILLADDYGNFRAASSFIDGTVYWAWEGSRQPERTARELDDLAKVGLIHLYEVNGQRYGHLNGWEKHQKVIKPGKPRVPCATNSDQLGITSSTDLRPPITDQRPSIGSDADASRKTHCPKSQAAGDEVRAWLEKWQINGDKAEVAAFLDHHRSKGNSFIDWTAAWRNWKRNGEKFGRAAQPQQNHTGMTYKLFKPEEKAEGRPPTAEELAAMRGFTRKP